MTSVAVGLLFLFAAAAILAPLVAPFDPTELHRSDRLLGPSSRYLLGTDQTGRDQLSRLIYGGRVSLWVGVAPVLCSALLGTTIGLVSAFFGGTVDSGLQRVMDAVMAFPPLVLVLVTVALLGTSLTNVIIAMAFVFIPTINRVARAATLSVLGLPFIEAGRTLGASNPRLIIFHVLPNIAGPIAVISTSLIGTAILAEASLSFLGLGVPPPQPTWGNMLSSDSRDIFTVAPWLAIYPGAAITAVVLSFNLVGDSIRDILDPRRIGR